MSKVKYIPWVVKENKNSRTFTQTAIVIGICYIEYWTHVNGQYWKHRLYGTIRFEKKTLLN